MSAPTTNPEALPVNLALRAYADHEAAMKAARDEFAAAATEAGDRLMFALHEILGGPVIVEGGAADVRALPPLTFKTAPAGAPTTEQMRVAAEAIAADFFADAPAPVVAPVTRAASPAAAPASTAKAKAGPVARAVPPVVEHTDHRAGPGQMVPPLSPLSPLSPDDDADSRLF